MYLFIKVKGSRPMTYQYLTVDMVNGAKENGGFINQKMFKSTGKYDFDSLILADFNMQVLDNYITFVSPFLSPQCDYVLVTRNGGQHSKMGDVMSKLVFDAIGKYVHPTRYRQIVETQSLNQLTCSEQRILSEDQKHSSSVAKIHYQKQRSREVAVMAMNGYRNCREARVQRSTKTCTRDLAVWRQLNMPRSNSRPTRQRTSHPRGNRFPLRKGLDGH